MGALRRVVLKSATAAFGSQQRIDAQWRDLGYVGRPEAANAAREHEAFVELFRSAGVEVRTLPADEGTGLDSIYVRDAAVVCDRGVVLCSMGKAARATEPAAQERAYRQWGIPVHGRIEGEGRLEGGDVVWLDERTVAVGRGYRTNDEGIRQLRGLLAESCDELLVVPLPHWRGPGDVFHLMSIVSPIDLDLALVYSPLLPVPFREALLERGIELVEVPDQEFASMGTNVLALAPRRCLALEGNPQTRRRLEAAGAEVLVYEGREISAKGCGGPTCLTRPLLRDRRPERA